MEHADREFLDMFGFLFRQPGWSDAKTEATLAAVRFRSFEAGTALIREGEVCTSVPFVLRGSIRVFKSTEGGREITLYWIEAGQSCILSSGCVTGLAHFPAMAVAQSATEAAMLPAELVKRLIDESRPFRDFVLGQYSARMAEVMELVQEVAFRHVDGRLAEWLASRAGERHSVRTTHQELAGHLGTSREVVSRILKDWEQRGAVEIARGEISLLAGFGGVREGL